MVSLEDLAAAALRRDNLTLRSLVQDFLREHPHLQGVSRPQTEDQAILGIAAGLIELLAQRNEQAAPDWSRTIGAMPEPFILLEAALRMKRLRALCEAESPEPLRKRGLYAPPDFLTFA
jgi:hypothetical protein